MRKLPFGIYKLTMLRSAAFQSCRMFFHGALRAVPKNYALEHAPQIAEKFSRG